MSPPPVLSKSVQFGLLLFVALPCLPGLIFLLAGLWVDPHAHRGDPSPAGQTSNMHAGEQASGLYLAGGLVLLVGTACSGFVVWKIVHPTPLPDDEGDAGADSPDRSA